MEASVLTVAHTCGGAVSEPDVSAMTASLATRMQQPRFKERRQQLGCCLVAYARAGDQQVSLGRQPGFARIEG